MLGREHSGQVMLADPTLSRAHLELEWDEPSKTHVARDLGSRNGSSIDGVRLGQGWTPLAPGVVLRAGDVLFVYENSHTLAQADARTVSREAVPGRSLAAKRLRSELARAASDLSPALIFGETGTGKELIAGELHRLSGRSGAFVAVNCATLRPELITSQLFGHVRGAFTGAVQDHPGLFKSAEKGTLFLDEIGELPLELQPKLLRAIQEREIFAVGSTKGERIDVRIVAATHQPLQLKVEREEFRRDLYARLALWEIRVPPLRERRADVLSWVERFDARFRAERDAKTHALRFQPSAAEDLLRAEWKENLRGLDRLVRSISDVARETGVSRDDLPSWIRTVNA